jgi:hypothetical protein
MCCVFTEQHQEAQAYSKSVADLQAIRDQLQEGADGYEAGHHVSPGAAPVYLHAPRHKLLRA